MFVERIAYPIESLGPGERVVLWFRGCSKHCKGCANPELWEPYASDAHKDKEQLSPLALSQALVLMNKEYGVHRITLTGGDPLEQAEEVAVLLEGIRNCFDDILLYTGFTLEEAQESISSHAWTRIEANVDVVIDGPYIEELNDNKVVLRGSTNQIIHFISKHIEGEYRRYMARGRSVENYVWDGNILSVGIHNREIVPTGS